MKTILLTGESGFIGGALLEGLISKEYHIISLVRDLKKFRSKKKIDKVERIQFEIGAKNYLDPELFKKVDILIHLAWEDVDNVNSNIHTNYTQNAHFEFLKEFISQGTKSVFVLGSCFEYGLCSGKITEQSILNPKTNYGLAKVNLFKKLNELKENLDFKLTWGRLFYVYGNGQRNTIYSDLCDSVRNGDSHFMMSSGEQKLDYLHISEVIQRIINLIEIDRDLGAVNICSGEPIELWRLVTKWIKDFDFKIKLERGAIASRNFEPKSFWGSTDYYDSTIRLYLN